MIKYVPGMTNVVLEEIPGKLTLAVEISNCQGSCAGCHSPFLKEDIGEELTPAAVTALIKANFGVNCFLFLGEGADRQALLDIAGFVRGNFPNIELALYSGRPGVEDDLWETFDYVKTGPYIAELGPLNSPTTNQRLHYKGVDITSKFWHRGLEDKRKL